MRYPECLGKVKVYNNKPLRFSDEVCIFCDYNYVCTYLSGLHVHTDMISFCIRLVFTELTRKQIISYIRDHYEISGRTASDVYADTMKRLSSHYYMKRAHKRALSVQLKYPAMLYKVGMSQKARAAFLTRCGYRTSLCLPFISRGYFVRLGLDQFEEVFGFDQHPLVRSTDGVKRCTFYPVAYDSVPPKQYSAVLIDSQRTYSSSNTLQYFRSLGTPMTPGRALYMTLEDLMFYVSPEELATPVPLNAVVRFYARGGSPLIAIHFSEFTEADVDFFKIQEGLPDNYFVREGINFGDDECLLFISKVKGDK